MPLLQPLVANTSTGVKSPNDKGFFSVCQVFTCAFALEYRSPSLHTYCSCTVRCQHQHTHARTPHMDTAMLAAYAAPWPVAMTSVFALTGVVLAVIPVRRGEKWAVWTCLVTFAILLIARITTDARCLVVLNPHQHGCHTFIFLVLVGITGLILSAFGRQTTG